MAASKSSETETKDTKSAGSGYDPKTNPSGASDEQLKKGEMVGKVRGRDVDPSYHTYEFTDPHTGEPVEWTPPVHDVPVGVNSDGSVKTEKGDKVFAIAAEGAEKPKGGADTKQSEGANQGEAGEHTKAGPSARS